MSARLALALLLALGMAAGVMGVCVGSNGWSPPWAADPDTAVILWDIRLPRSLGAWLAGALLGLGGAVAQGVFRNPLADPYLLGSASGASLGVALLLAALGLSPSVQSGALRLGLTGAAFVGALLAVALTVALARGVQQVMRLLLAGVVVGVVLAAVKELVVLAAPDVLRPLQAFLLGTTGLLGWPAVQVLAAVLLPCLLAAWLGSRALDAMSLGDATARSLGLPLGAVRAGLVAVMALTTAASVAQAGLIAFVGLVAPHLVRSLGHAAHRRLLSLSAAAGGLLLLCADVLARAVIAPQELPVGVITAVLGGGYLLWLMHRRPLGGRP